MNYNNLMKKFLKMFDTVTKYYYYLLYHMKYLYSIILLTIHLVLKLDEV